MVKWHLIAWFLGLEESWVDMGSQTEVTAKIMYFGLCEYHCLVSAKLRGVM